MINIGRSVRALFRQPPELPVIAGDAFVFGSAPDPVVPPEILRTATIVTANASQVWLERLRLPRPDITCMRTNMADGGPTDALKQETLRGRSTGTLVLYAHKSDPRSQRQLAVLDKIDFRYDKLLILDRTDCHVLHNRVLDPRLRYLLKTYSPSKGVQAILLSLAGGASRVVVAGLSFRRSGSSISDLDYKRIHVEADLAVFSRIVTLGLPVYATDEWLARDAGLPIWKCPT